MRDYAKVSPQFWTGKTGKALKASGHEAVIVGLYLMTSPHANMIGVYHCPLAYIAFDTGLTFEGASEGLQRCIEAEFCTFDSGSDYVFVHEFAAYQVGEELDPKDNRCKAVANELSKVPKGQCSQAFRDRYAVPYRLTEQPQDTKPLKSPLKAPSKPETGAGAGTGKEPPQPPAIAEGGFSKFWNLWPQSPRKAARAQCESKWKTKGCEQVAEAIFSALEAWKKSDEWQGSGGAYIPAPLVWLNQARWEAIPGSAVLPHLDEDGLGKGVGETKKLLEAQKLTDDEKQAAMQKAAQLRQKFKMDQRPTLAQ